MHLRSLSLATLMVFSISLPLQAQGDFEYWPDTNYDPAIPTVFDVLGYQPGERITWHRDAIRYFHALAEAAPDRIEIVEYARSWQNRELIYAVVSSAENNASLSEAKANMQALADPRITNEAAANRIIAQQPAVTWLSYGVHGNEISSTDASMLTAYHLLASRGIGLFTILLLRRVWFQTRTGSRQSMMNPGRVAERTITSST